MKTNMGILDRIIRIILAVSVPVLYYFKIINGITAIVLFIIAAIFLVTSLVGFCPLYFPFKITTKKKV